FYPAQVAAKDAPMVRPLPTIASHAGPVAVLDAFPQMRASVDVVGHTGSRPAAGDRAGLRLAAVVHAELPHARIEAMRVAASEALENGRFEVFGTTDQLI